MCSRAEKKVNVKEKNAKNDQVFLITLPWEKLVSDHNSGMNVLLVSKILSGRCIGRRMSGHP